MSLGSDGRWPSPPSTRPLRAGTGKPATLTRGGSRSPSVLRRPRCRSGSYPNHPPTSHSDALERLHQQTIDHHVEAADDDHADDDAINLPEGARGADEI